MTRPVVRLGTRGSRLALIQAEMVRSRLVARSPELRVEVVPIRTRGDRLQDKPLSVYGGKGFFIKEIEDALLDGRVDLAVHSLKDLPTDLPPGLVLGGVLAREEPRDALATADGAGLEALVEGDAVATSSSRRRAQLLAMRPDLSVVDVRGNVDTRLAKLDEGRFRALVVAAVGLVRMGLEDRVSGLLDPEVMLPASCQGTIGMEVRSDDGRMLRLVQAIGDARTMACSRAERAVLHAVGGGCQLPLGCLAEIDGTDVRTRATGGRIRALIAAPDGSRVIRREGTAAVDRLEELASDLAAELLGAGGREILEEIGYRDGS